jgi:hypothetical protein
MPNMWVIATRGMSQKYGTKSGKMKPYLKRTKRIFWIKHITGVDYMRIIYCKWSLWGTTLNVSCFDSHIKFLEAYTASGWFLLKSTVKSIKNTFREDMYETKIVNCRPYPHVHGQLDTMHIRYQVHIHIQCIHVLGLSSPDERPSHKSRVRIGRVTTRLLLTILPLVHSSFCLFRIRLESVTSRHSNVMQCLPIVAVGQSYAETSFPITFLNLSIL